jgi:hypothetical protein
MNVPFVWLSAWSIFFASATSDRMALLEALEIRSLTSQPSLWVNFCIVVSILKEAKNVKRSVEFQCVTIEGSEKMFSSRPVASYSSCNVMMKLNYGIRIHYEVTENWMHTVSKLRYKRLVATSCSCNWRVRHSCTKEGIFSEVPPE